MAKSRSSKKLSRTGWLFRSLLLLIFIASFLGGLVWAGRWGLEHLRGRERYEIPFADIDCEPPVGMDRHAFLDEVQFESRLPARINVLDEQLDAKLREGFAKHPWVEKVDEVSVKPPKHVLVKLTHRTPVLAVRVGESLRAVDGQGVLLYTNAPTAGLPIYDGDANPPQGKAGTRWGDPNVEAAARKLKK